MNIDISALSTFFKNLARPYPARDWFIICACAALVCAAGLVLTARLFLGVQTGSIIGAPVEVPRAPLPVSRDAMKIVLESYQTRAANFAKKSFAPVDLADPRPRAVRR